MELNNIISSGLLEMYVLGLTSSAETQQVEAWITSYPEVAAEVREIELGMESYAMANAVEPGTKVKDKVMASLSDSNSNTVNRAMPAKVVQMSSNWKWVAAASIILLIGSGIFNAVYFNKYKEASVAYEQTQQILTDRNNELAEVSRNMNLVQSKYSEPVALHGLPASPEAGAKIFWMKNTGEVYLDYTNLPAAPAGKQYQLWAIVDGKPVDGGMVITSKKGDKYNIQKMKTFGKAEAFAVTLETEGGNPTPKGEMYVMGKM